jgi:hypothetical protein
MIRPLSDANRAELAELQSDHWVIEYRPSIPKEVLEVARVSADTDPRADDTPLSEQATKPRLDSQLLRFTSVHGQPREVPIEVVRSIQVEVNHIHGAIDGAMLGALAGAGLGVLIGLESGDSSTLPPNSDCGGFCGLSAGRKAAIFGVLGGLLGLGAGLIVGAIVGHSEVVEFKERRP